MLESITDAKAVTAIGTGIVLLLIWVYQRDKAGIKERLDKMKINIDDMDKSISDNEKAITLNNQKFEHKIHNHDQKLSEHSDQFNSLIEEMKANSEKNTKSIKSAGDDVVKHLKQLIELKIAENELKKNEKEVKS